MGRFRFRFALLAFTAMPALANASGFDQYIGFGDSTLDSGYFRYHSMTPVFDPYIAAAVAAGNSGGFVGNGVMNSTLLAAKFGLTAFPVGSPGGGTNYAIGNAQTSVTSGPFLSTVQQIQNYLAKVHGKADPNALYVIHTGDNDRTPVMTNGAAWNAATPNYLSDQASALAAQVATLQAAGARTIMVSNSYDSAIYAGLGGEIAPANAANYALAVAHGENIWSDLTAAGVRFVPVDRGSVFAFVVKHPTLFGFTATSVLSASAPCTVSALICTTITPIQQQTGLFVDALHMTTAGQTIVADYEYSLVAAPSQISLITESAVQSGLSRIADVQSQIDLSAQRSDAFNAWTSAGANDLAIKNAPGFAAVRGKPWRGSFGMDYGVGSGGVLGAAFTLGGETAHFSSGGGFVQFDQTGSIYAGFTSGRLWSHAVASYGIFQNDITRQAMLGLYTDVNHGETSGHTLALALRGGGDFALAGATTGPVLGVVLQQVRLGAFTETGTSGTTALSFGGQTRDSAVTQLGWRASMVWADVQPFAEVEWDHELHSNGTSVAAALTTAPTAPYSMDAAPVASDWATASLGASYRVSSCIALKGTLSSVVANSRVDNYGGELSLSVRF
ncbi:MAG: autotransporter domain-containing protein [Rhizomicrobium sp.]